MRKCLLLLSLLFNSSVHAQFLLKKTVSIEGTVVGSACSVVVDNGVSRSGAIDFGTYNKAQRNGVINKPFQIKLYEPGATEIGCSAFLAGSGLVTFHFGDKAAGQLDRRGVVTYGAGNNVRIEITSTDVDNVSSTNVISSVMPTLTYPSWFASLGVFGFNARAVGLESASAGSYHGSLSLVVSYQ